MNCKVDEKYQVIMNFAREMMEGVDSAHDFLHVMRVYNLCLLIAQDYPNVDLDVLITAALLHDVARAKEKEGFDHAVLSAEIAEKFLRKLGYSEEKIEKVKHCILSHRFRGEIKPKTIEAKILSDADKLDALGAIGVARAFMLAGKFNQKIYSDTPLTRYVKENIVNGKVRDLSKHSPNLEFEIKLKKIPSRLYTEKAKQIAEERHKFMVEFFERLKMEIKGEK